MCMQPHVYCLSMGFARDGLPQRGAHARGFHCLIRIGRAGHGSGPCMARSQIRTGSHNPGSGEGQILFRVQPRNGPPVGSALTYALFTGPRCQPLIAVVAMSVSRDGFCNNQGQLVLFGCADVEKPPPEFRSVKARFLLAIIPDMVQTGRMGHQGLS